MDNEIKVGDVVSYCTLQKGFGHGALYTVMSVRGDYCDLKLLFAAWPSRRRKKRRAPAYRCTKVSERDIQDVVRTLEAVLAGTHHRKP
jgi:hypothetical protein